MKIGVVGKGGVGKTTVSSLLARAYIARGQRVVAVDTDSNPNLGLSFGLDLAATEAIPVLPRRLVVGSGGDCTLDQVISRYGIVTPAGVTVLSALRIEAAGAGCTCGGHSTVRSLLGEALEQHADITIVDMEAGIEHLSRSGGTLAHADVLVIVMEPTRKAVVTAARTIALAAELGIADVVGVGNKVHDAADLATIESLCAEYSVPLVTIVKRDPYVIEADRSGRPVSRSDAADLWAVFDRLCDILDSRHRSALESLR